MVAAGLSLRSDCLVTDDLDEDLFRRAFDLCDKLEKLREPPREAGEFRFALDSKQSRDGGVFFGG